MEAIAPRRATFIRRLFASFAQIEKDSKRHRQHRGNALTFERSGLHEKSSRISRYSVHASCTRLGQSERRDETRERQDDARRREAWL